MISAILLYNQKGEVLISRLYRDGLRRSIADVFRIQVISNPEVRSPILTIGSTSFMHCKSEDMYIVAVNRSNVDAGMVFEFLYKIVALGKSYFGSFNEQSVKENFTLVYELLDEMIDFGLPQNTEMDMLKQYIQTEAKRSGSESGSSAVTVPEALTRSKSIKALKRSKTITSQITGATPWRRDNVKHHRNEMFVDVVEKVNLLISPTGSVLVANVDGTIHMKSQLSGVPECTFGLNDTLRLDQEHDEDDPKSSKRGGRRGSVAPTGSVGLQDCVFHPCVKLNNFDHDRSINFVPPDGEFELMHYKCVENLSIPFKVVPSVQLVGKSRVEYDIVIKANFPKQQTATNVVINIPTPRNAAKTTINASNGKAKYDSSTNQIIWKVSRISGGSEISLRGTAELTFTTEKTPWNKPPISMDFEITMITCSGLVVRYLKVFEKSNYNTVKWVRYLMKGGSYEIRF
ncbi:AP-2 complex subunit mu [Yarrowia sp. C11]|nr:AP-2 complex subunit mu [Yarrowia sp. E02]KAG5371570.1 AP-2 complex subunit mu [Yarrowia sp. C11]